jgi:hypothetical protein
MRLRDLIMLEDDASGATAGAITSADIATVSYPLFVKGRTRREKRRNARAAVGQKMDNAPSYIGQGVFNERVAVEPDTTGYEPTKLTSPKFAVVVDTPSDYDWYKIGNHWHDRIIDPHEFGQEDSDTVMVASGNEDFKSMLAKLDKMGFTYKKIGGTHSQPEIHKGRKE